MAEPFHTWEAKGFTVGIHPSGYLLVMDEDELGNPAWYPPHKISEDHPLCQSEEEIIVGEELIRVLQGKEGSDG